jgi:small subunit ribosomal protein S13
MFSIARYNLLKKKFINSFRPVFGINKTSILKLKNFLGVNPLIPMSLLTTSQIQKSRVFFQDPRSPFFLHDLKQKKKETVANLVKLRCYRGIRHQLHFPVRGQRTHSNRKTCRRIYVMNLVRPKIKISKREIALMKAKQNAKQKAKPKIKASPKKK